MNADNFLLQPYLLRLVTIHPSKAATACLNDNFASSDTVKINLPAGTKCLYSSIASHGICAQLFSTHRRLVLCLNRCTRWNEQRNNLNTALVSCQVKGSPQMIIPEGKLVRR